jgi:hypothetical protein
LLMVPPNGARLISSLRTSLRGQQLQGDEDGSGGNGKTFTEEKNSISAMR